MWKKVIKYILKVNLKSSWLDKENITRYTTEIIADTLNILSRPEGSEKVISNPPPYSSKGTPNEPSKIDDLLSPDKEDLPF